MKSKPIVILSGLLMAVVLPAAYAGPEVLGVLKSAEDAQRVPEGRPAVMACSKCQTVVVETDKKLFSGWFQADKNHDCPNCGGHVKYSPVDAKTGAPVSYVHHCSKCGGDSAYTCANHK